ncbi:MAG TPA: 16S rRNA (cytosine(1402)-N(4))-methyltransferase RsmH [Planctomycetes bacterium]|nr:16S rRNA (cytosine(1402)-N(4))-methyltransferase RsmH [Planctomycetota bacterium]
MHVPVLIDETLKLLRPVSGGVYVDGTAGAGGHAKAILDASAPDGIILALDWDEHAIAAAAEQLAAYGERVRLIRRNHADIADVVREAGVEGKIRGILLDLGLSSIQLADPVRGFSFQTGGMLDMRMSSELPENAAMLVNRLSEQELAGIIAKYGEERRSRAVARAIMYARSRKPIRTAEELAAIAARAARGKGRRRIHPATRTFQALRIAVNHELENLQAALLGGRDVLAPGGVFAVIAFHSLEDRIVKRTFREWAASGDFELMVKKPITPCEDEVYRNPRSRSARLRAVVRKGG